MFQGELLHKVQKKTYLKLIVGVETGYNVDFYTIRVRDPLTIKDICLSDQVLFSGQYIWKRNISQFQLHFIIKHSFRQCSECDLPLTSNTCVIRHDREAQKLNGEWRVVHKIQRDGNIKVFFEKSHFVFAAVATPEHWYHSLFKKLSNNDNVSISGWRYKQKTSIKTISKNPINIKQEPTNTENQESESE